MRIFLYISVIFLLFSCSSPDTDWDSGAQAQNAYRQEQQQEQVDTTGRQDTTSGKRVSPFE